MAVDDWKKRGENSYSNITIILLYNYRLTRTDKIIAGSPRPIDVGFSTEQMIIVITTST
jgi:hypothetical protein